MSLTWATNIYLRIKISRLPFCIWLSITWRNILNLLYLIGISFSLKLLTFSHLFLLFLNFWRYRRCRYLIVSILLCRFIFHRLSVYPSHECGLSAVLRTLAFLLILVYIHILLTELRGSVLRKLICLDHFGVIFHLGLIQERPSLWWGREHILDLKLLIM
jgi:hypothetical protein